jgi:type IV pilus assembly protein PilW
MHVINRNRMAGLSLVELMVALGISVLLLMGVVALFVSSRSSYETTERLSRIQENGRFALDQIASDVRAAGYYDCARPTMGKRAADFRINPLIAPFPEPDPDELDPDAEPPPPPDLRWNFAEPVRGFNGAGDDGFEPALDADAIKMNPKPSPQGDVLVLRVPQREVRAVEVREKQAQPFHPLRVRHIDPMPFGVGDTVMISDCEARAFFQVTNYTPGTGTLEHAAVAASSGGGSGIDRPGNRSSTLLHPFDAGARIVPITTMIYYIAPSSDNPAECDGDMRGSGCRMSLYRKNGGAVRSDEIAEGIERMEILYGVDRNPIDGRVDAYVSAEKVTDWNSVLTVQVSLLARAPEEYGNDRDTQTYVLLAAPEDEAVSAGPFNDRNQRKVFTATLALRNQIVD